MNKNLLILLVVVVILLIMNKNKILGGIGELDTEVSLPIRYNSYDLRCSPKIVDNNNLLNTNKFNNNPVFRFVGNKKCLV